MNATCFLAPHSSNLTHYTICVTYLDNINNFFTTDENTHTHVCTHVKDPSGSVIFIAVATATSLCEGAEIAFQHFSFIMMDIILTCHIEKSITPSMGLIQTTLYDMVPEVMSSTVSENFKQSRMTKYLV